MSESRVSCMQILSICSSKAFTIVLLLHYCVPSVSDEGYLTATVLRLLATRLQFLGKERRAGRAAACLIRR